MIYENYSALDIVLAYYLAKNTTHRLSIHTLNIQGLTRVGANRRTSIMNINQKKHYIIRHAGYLTDEDRMDVAKIISREGKSDLLRKSPDGGSRINLDLLSEKIINQIYVSMEYKLSKQSIDS